jgi:ABC-type nitrate/sulfonate/bicarbonate transport system substrate-binding protein
MVVGMDRFGKTFNKILEHALARGGLTEEEVTELPKQILHSFVPQAVDFMLKNLKKTLPSPLRERKKSDAGFERRNYRR